MGSVLFSVIALGVLIVVHEAGHFWFARRGGMRVRSFSVGFGPPIFKHQVQDTEYRVGFLPLGGYVQVDGLNPHDGTDPTDPKHYTNRRLHQRLLMVLGGPLANYLLGFVLLALFFAFFFSIAAPPLRVLQVVDGSPAHLAAIRTDDLIVGTSSKTFERAEDFHTAIRQAGSGPLTLLVDRNGTRTLRVLTPIEGRIGVAYEPATHVSSPLGLLGGLRQAGHQVLFVSKQFLDSLAQLPRMLMPGAKRDVEVSGPIGLVKGLSRRMEQSWTQSIGDLGNLSVMLGLFNLLPIPGLDGSRLMFLLLAWVRRKEVEPKLEAWIHGVGVMMLLGLMLVVSVFDILR
jgi:regulator of sigma E protease